MKLPRFRCTGLPPAVLTITALTGFSENASDNPPAHPNILLIMVDQMQTPPEGYGPFQGAVQDLKDILSFRPVAPGNSYSRYFEGFLRLQQNGVVMKKHYTASAASVPSRCCIMTGQYPTVTGVSQTDGIFKSAQDVPFLDPDGTPTIGDWLKQLGYTTHYFGKWHVSEAGPPTYLQPWGFSDWAISYPEPHGGSADNLGVYRDVVFANHVVDFLEKQGNNPPGAPWFTVASLVDPHDVSSWPSNWQVYDTNGVVPWVDYPPPLMIPAMGDTSLWGTVSLAVNSDTISKTFRVPLNPDGFPSENSYLPPSFDEIPDKKPSCQYDYSFKMGLAFGTNVDYTFKKIGDNVHHSPHPFQLQDSDYVEWCRNYSRFYFYCQYLADLQIRRILKALDDNHLTQNTIVVFISDHGEMAAAHGGMIQKWHNAYEETTRVPMVISSPLVNPSSGILREIQYTTSSIDLVPTLIGLAGYNPDSLLAIPGIIPGHTPSAHFPGVNLAAYIKGTVPGPIIGPGGAPRAGVLFMTNDMITELGDDSYLPQFNMFLGRIDSTINMGYQISPNTVCQPNNVRALCTGDWKIVQYFDPGGVSPLQWELYCLTNDPNELINLDDYTTGEVRSDVSVPGMTMEELIMKNALLKQELANVTGLGEPAGNPCQLRLFQNQPNPVVKSASVSFMIPKPGNARLSLADASGNEIRVLADRNLPAGMHTYAVDAAQLPPGVYLISLRFEQKLEVKKMIVMK